MILFQLGISLNKRLAIGIALSILVLSYLAYVYLTSSVEANNSVSIGVEFNTHASPIWIDLKNHLFRSQGIEVKKVFKFRTGLELAAALARGDVQVGWACLGPILLIIDKGINVKIIGKYHNYGYELVVNPSKIRSIQDLNDSTVYTPGKGSPAYLLLLKTEEKYGIRFSTVRFMKPQNILAALLSGEAHAAFLPEHYASLAVYKGMRILLTAKQIWPNMPGSFVVASTSLINKNPQLIRKLLNVTYEGIRIIRRNITEAIEADSWALGVPQEVANRSIHMLEWNTTIDLKEIQEYINFMYNHGLLHHKLNATEIIDTEFIKGAVG